MAGYRVIDCGSRLRRRPLERRRSASHLVLLALPRSAGYIRTRAQLGRSGRRGSASSLFVIGDVAARVVAVAGAARPRSGPDASPAAGRLHRAEPASRSRSIARRRDGRDGALHAGRASAGGDGRRVVRHRWTARVLSAGGAVRGADRGVRVPDRAAARPVAAVRDLPRRCCCCCRRSISSARSRTIRFSRKPCRRCSRWRCGGRWSMGRSARSSLNASIVAVFLVGACSCRGRSGSGRRCWCFSRWCCAPTCRHAIAAALSGDRVAAVSRDRVAAFVGSMGMDGDRAHQRRGAASVARESWLVAAVAGGDRRARGAADPRTRISVALLLVIGLQMLTLFVIAKAQGARHAVHGVQDGVSRDLSDGGARGDRHRADRRRIARVGTGGLAGRGAVADRRRAAGVDRAARRCRSSTTICMRRASGCARMAARRAPTTSSPTPKPLIGCTWRCLAIRARRERMQEVDRYDPRAAVAPWITSEGRSYAIADLRLLPDEVLRRPRLATGGSRVCAVRQRGGDQAPGCYNKRL